MAFVSAGKAAVADLVGGVTGAAVFDYLAVGTGTTAVAAGDTTLETEVAASGLSRAQDSSPTRTTTNVTNDTLVLNYTFTVTGSVTIGEAGVFNASSGGTLLARTVLSPTKGVSSGDSYTLTYNLVFA